ncbi:hypothetical protein MKK67_04410, partial [Methylobacterium sp. J-072]|nr:hypothetical protein [Methylobacterium sp. J-072]
MEDGSRADPAKADSSVQARGRIALDGIDLTRLSPDRRARAGLAYVPQGREIFPDLTVAENLRVAA